MSMVWAVAETGSTRKGNKDGWPLDCPGTSADWCGICSPADCVNQRIRLLAEVDC